MPDVFISYSTADQKLAEFVHRHLQTEGLKVFMASASLSPGMQWSQDIMNNVRLSPWIIFLASRAACQSPWVQQELGIAIGANKHIVPVVWDIEPSQLPGWVGQLQALDLRGKTIEQVCAEIAQIASNIKRDKTKGLLIAGALVAGLLFLAVFGRVKAR